MESISSSRASAAWEQRSATSRGRWRSSNKNRVRSGTDLEIFIPWQSTFCRNRRQRNNSNKLMITARGLFFARELFNATCGRACGDGSSSSRRIFSACGRSFDYRTSQRTTPNRTGIFPHLNCISAAPAASTAARAASPAMSWLPRHSILSLMRGGNFIIPSRPAT